MKKIISFITLIVLFFSNFSFIGEVKAESKSGVFYGIDWEITDDGVLKLGKRGETQNFEGGYFRNYRGSYKYPWNKEYYDILEVNIVGKVILYGNIDGFFGNLDKVNYINNLSNFDTSNVTSMMDLFYGMESLKNINLSNFDTSKVTNMNSMFYNTLSLTNLDLSNFDTKNVTDMGDMFVSYPWYNHYGQGKDLYRSSLKELNISSFDTRNVVNMEGMFFGANLLEKLDLSNFDTSKVTNMKAMFSDTKSLKELNISSFDTRNVISMAGMFYGADSLEKITLGEKWTKWIDNSYLDEKNGNYGNDYKNKKTWKNGNLVKTSKELYEEYPKNVLTYKGTYTLITDSNNILYTYYYGDEKCDTCKGLNSFIESKNLDIVKKEVTKDIKNKNELIKILNRLNIDTTKTSFPILIINTDGKETYIDGAEKIEKYFLNILGENSTCKTMVNILGDYNKDYILNFADADKAQNKKEFQMLAKVGIIKGTEKGLLEFERNMTKAEFLAVTLMTHCYEIPKNLDLEKNITWQEKVEKIGREIGLIEGEFYPNEAIEKVDALRMIIKIGKITNNQLNLQDLAIFRETNSFASRDYFVKLFIDVLKQYVK